MGGYTACAEIHTEYSQQTDTDHQLTKYSSLSLRVDVLQVWQAVSLFLSALLTSPPSSVFTTCWAFITLVELIAVPNACQTKRRDTSVMIPHYSVYFESM